MRPTFSRELGRRSCASPYCVSDALCASYDSPSLHPGERPLSLRGRSVPRSASGGNIQRGLAGHGLGGLPVRRPPPLGSAPGECAGLTMSAPTSSGCERSTMDCASSAPLVDLFVKPMALRKRERHTTPKSQPLLGLDKASCLHPHHKHGWPALRTEK